jgi:hypothetical protein
MIFVECRPDYVLVSALISNFLRLKIEHSYGKSAVLRKLVRGKGSSNYENSVGMIDEDPRSSQPAIVKKFVELADFPEHEIKLKYHRPLNNHLLIICPRLEEWIIKAAAEANVNMTEYGLPNIPGILHQTVNLDIEKFRLLVNDLKSRSRRIRKLQQSLDELLSNQS